MCLKIRFIIIVLLFALSSFFTKGQSIYSYSGCSNTLYRGLLNILHVDYCGHSDSLFLLTDHGVVKPIDSPNNIAYTWSEGDTTKSTTQIFLCKICEEDTVLISTFLFKIYDMPQPVFYFVSKSSGEISKEDILRHPYVQVLLDRSNCFNRGISIIFLLVEFSYIIVSKDGIKHYHKTSNRFNEKEIEEFEKLEKGDILLFYNIFVTSGFLEKPIRINPSEFVIE